MPPKRAFEPSDVWSLKQVSHPDVAPGGRTVAFVVGTPDRESDRIATSIWVAPADGSAAARPLTTGTRDIAPRWSPDGRSIAFVRGPQQPDEDSDEGQVYVAPLDGGEPYPVTAAAYGAASPAWSPDGRGLAYTARTGEWKRPSERTAVERSAPKVISDLYNRYDNMGRFDGRRRHVFVVDLPAPGSSANEGRQVTDGDWDDAAPAWSPDGGTLAFTSDRSDSRGETSQPALWVVPVAGRRRPKRLSPVQGVVVGPVWSPDGSTLAYVGHQHRPGMSSGNAHLWVVPADGSAPPRSLTAGLDRTAWGLIPSMGATHAWTPDGAAVLAIVNDGGTLGIYRCGLAPGAADADDQPVLLHGGDRQILTLASAAGATAFVAQWPSSPPELTCVVDGDEREVTALNAGLRRQVRLAGVSRRAHRAADGTEIQSYLIRPAGIPKGQPVPTVLEIHGGPHGWHPQASMTALYQSLAGAGYAVLLPNPRGSHGFGEDFAGRCVGDWGGADFDDLMGAVDAVVEQEIADPEQLFVAGYSYGGFMTSWTVGHTDRFRAACVSAPVADLVSMWGTTDIPHFNEFESGGSPYEVPDYYAEHSPVTYLPKVNTPVQVLHWEGDLRCPIGQGEEVFQGLRKLGKEAVMVRYPGGFHVRRTPSQMADFVQRHLDWFASHR